MSRAHRPRTDGGMNLFVFSDAESLARAAAERVVTLAGEAVAAHGWFDLALSGGRTPAALHRRLAGDDVRGRIAWDRVRVWFADERAVPPNDPESNFRMARETLLDAVGIAPRNVHRIRDNSRQFRGAGLCARRTNDGI